jgi:hypothetical protein
MANVARYREIIQQILIEIHSYSNSNNSNGIDEEIVFDTERDRYLLIDVGWHNKEYIYGTLVHIDIKDDKIWIQRNNTEINLAERLLENGVAKTDIVLGLHSPFMRQFTGYAVG